MKCKLRYIGCVISRNTLVPLTLEMHLHKLSLTEAKLLLDPSISGQNLLFGTVSEMIGLRAIKVVENRSVSDKERYIIEKGEEFESYATGYYTKFYKAVQENHESLANPDLIREAPLTPYFLIEKVFRKCNKRYGNYKTEIKASLKDKNLIKANFFPWQKFNLTVEGTKLKEALSDSLNEFEVGLRENDKEKVINLAERLGLLILLIQNLNKESLSNLKRLIDASTPLSPGSSLDVLVDVIWFIDFEWLNAKFDFLDLMNEG